jgi:hypothetical protein
LRFGKFSFVSFGGALALTVTISLTAQAQMMPGMGMGGMGGPPPGGGGGGKKKKAPPKKVNEDEPEMHAAPGASDTVLGSGSEPSLPTNPLALTKPTFERIGTDLPFDNQQTGRASESETKRRFYGVYYSESSGSQQLKLTLPPLWANRKQPSYTNPKVTDDASLYGLLYYNRRSAERADDIFFPLFWNLRDIRAGERTTVVGPFVNRSTKDGRDDWLAPLWFTGKHGDSGYTLLPPLLYYHNWKKNGGFTLAGPGFCSWSGGNTCDTRSAKSIDFGIAPLYFATRALLRLQRPRSFLGEPVGPLLQIAQTRPRSAPRISDLLVTLAQRCALHHDLSALPLRVRQGRVALRKPAVRDRAWAKQRAHICYLAVRTLPRPHRTGHDNPTLLGLP